VKKSYFSPGAAFDLYVTAPENDGSGLQMEVPHRDEQRDQKKINYSTRRKKIATCRSGWPEKDGKANFGAFTKQISQTNNWHQLQTQDEDHQKKLFYHQIR
jgi:hypothetical protein